MSALLERLVGLFPRPFRRRFGDELRAQLRRDVQRARARGRFRALLFAIPTALDLVRSALAERWNPTWNDHRPPLPEGDNNLMARDFFHDLRLALRSLSRSPGFALVTILTLGLAIGINVGIFSTVETVLLDPLPFGQPDRLVRIAGTAPGSDLPSEFSLALEFYRQYADESRLLEEVAVYNSFTNTFRVGDRVERIRMSAPTPNLFRTLGVEPLLGRLPVAEDERTVMVISHALWVDWFGADPEVIGRTIPLSGELRTIVGVMGPDFWFPSEDTRLWFPIPVEAEQIEIGRFGMPLVGRLAAGADHAALVTELDQLADRLPERFGGSSAYVRMIEQYRPVVRSLEAELLGDLSGPLWVLLGSVVVVLLIACANVANLFLVRAERRQRALAVRRALGAGRWALVRSQMAEALVLAAGAGATALVLAWWSTPLLVRVAPSGIPRLQEAGLSPATLAFALAACLFAAFACGLPPAIHASAPRRTGLAEAGGRGSTRGRNWGRDGLVVAQTALALVLLIGSGLLFRSFQELRRVDPGYDVEDVFTFQIAPEGEHLTDAASFARFHMDFARRLSALPGVDSVGIVENLPLNEGLAGAGFVTEEAPSPDEALRLNYTQAGPGYFETMEIERLAGRTFRETDHTSELGNVVVSREAADALWPGQEPIGKRLQRVGLGTWETVVGVVDDIRQYDFRGDTQPLVYFPLVGQSETSRVISSPAYVLGTSRAEEIAPEVRALVREVAPEAPMYRVYTMEGLAADSMVQLSFTMLAIGVVSTLALLLGAIGLFGVLSYVVAARTREIGVRMALGARARRVRTMVVRQGARLVLAGVALGLVTALASTRALGSLLFGVNPIDPVTFVGMSLTMILVGLLASYLPAHRASSVDPIESLRED